MLHYILQTIAFQLFFLIVYDIFLKKETFFNWNRAYLLITAIASLTLPFLKFESIRTVVPQQFVIRLPEVLIGNVSQESVNSSEILPLEPSMSTTFAWGWEHVFYAGMILATLILIYKIIKISILINKNPKRWKGNLLIVNLMKSSSAFSFFHYVFLGELIKEDDKEAILKHESVHVAQKHTMDLLLFEILRILFWFNPLIYMYQNRMTTLHEYIADSKAVKQGNKSQYYQNLLSQVFDTQHISFTNTFYQQSLIKKRIVMLSKAKSHQTHLLKYALLIPMVFSILIYTSCQTDSENKLEGESLEQYSYVLKMPGKMTDDQKEIHDKFESFLKNNQDYVAWAEIDYIKDEVSYSIHSKDEKVPDGYRDLQVNFKDGNSYTMYMDLNGDMPSSSKGLKYVPNDYSDASEVPFSILDQVPMVEDCENLASNDEKRQCLSDYISSIVGENFNTSLGKELGLIGRQRISVIFKIGKDGLITDVQARAPHPGLEAEAIRVVQLFPQMIPGKHNGKNVVVPYSLPIIFEVNE